MLDTGMQVQHPDQADGRGGLRMLWVEDAAVNLIALME
jgi:hypothetical protein